ncbi:DUF2961 domain-containing protein [bacterium]|nr:DUF2961 domain-containing protein [bacterium]
MGRPLVKQLIMIVAAMAFVMSAGLLRAADLALEPAPDLYRIPDGVQTRWASAENWLGEKGKAAQSFRGRKGSPFFELAPGEQKVLAEVKGQAGTVRRIWITIKDRSPEMLRGMKIEMFWDGATEPAVSAPLGDFFCQGLGRMVAFDSALFSSPEGRSFCTTIPMPFRTGMKIVVTNESGKPLTRFFYDVNYTLGDKHDDNVLYFHAYWRRENPTTMQKDFEILPKVTGRGRYLGAVLSVIPNTNRYYRTWWGEGEVKAYIDGDTELPTLAGTGTEDYIGTGWGQGQYACKYFGSLVADEKLFQYAFYRLHIPDPVFFHQDCRVTIQQIGLVMGDDVKLFQKADSEPLYITTEAGTIVAPKDKLGATLRYRYYERQDDWAACAWFYLDKPTNGLPEIAPAKERIAGLAAPPQPKPGFFKRLFGGAI